MDESLRITGFPNISWMLIQTPTEMITTGVRSPVGIKVLGPDLKQIEAIGKEIERVLTSVPGTRSAFAERLNEGYYLDLIVNRREAARYGLTVGDVQTLITSAIGGENVTTTVEGRLKLIGPFTLAVILLLLYLNFRSLAKSLIVLLSVPFAVIGAFWYLHYLGYNLSVAVWVGIIALAGVAAETGVVMLVYLDEAFERRVREDRMATRQDLDEAIVEGAAQRVRPVMMTVSAIIGGLLPIMWTTGTGADG